MKKMDDQRFDDIIKQKVGNYEDTEFDPSALAALHHQMAGLSVWPWYSRYKTELLVAGGMALCTLLIVASQWHYTVRENDLLKQNATEVIALQGQIKSLIREIGSLKNFPHTADSKLKLNPSVSDNSILLTQRIEYLELTLIRLQKELEVFQASSSNQNRYSTERSTSEKDGSQSGYSLATRRVSPKLRERFSKEATEKSAIAATREKELSLETLRALEKHYRNGIGIRLGPSLELSHGLYDAGTSKIDYGGGIVGDFILSPSLSIETGGRFSHRSYEVTEDNLIGSQLPNVDHTLGPLLSAEVDSWILDIPLNLKYRHPINRKSFWVAGLGYSAQIFTRQLFEYEYGVDGNPAARLSTATHVDNLEMYPGTLNISIGLDRQLKNKKAIETTLFYQYGLGASGLEQVKASFLGLRSTYWFTLK